MRLRLGLPPERFGAALRRNVVPAGWIAALLDGSGTIVARSRDAQRFVGQKATASLLERVLAQRQGTLESITKEGVPVFTAFSRSSVSNWSVAVGAPKAALTADANRSTAWVVAGALIALGLGLGLASRLARRITASVQGLVGPALALGSGRPVQLPPTGLQETEAVGAAISQAALMLAQAQHIAHHDGLTGLCNRLLFDEVAIRQVAAAQRNKLSLAVLAIDLDEFKTVNDMQGHAAGDAVLKLAAERITGSIRASDIAARFGGDEFAVLLADTDLAGARVIADKLVLALAMPYPNVLAAVSASIGIAVLSASNATVADLLERADRALYEAKKAGKRRAVSEG